MFPEEGGLAIFVYMASYILDVGRWGIWELVHVAAGRIYAVTESEESRQGSATKGPAVVSCVEYEGTGRRRGQEHEGMGSYWLLVCVV